MPSKRLGLVAARQSAGLSQERLAERLDVERSTVQRWEAGQSAPQPWQRPRLARVLGISDGRLAELLAASPARMTSLEPRQTCRVLPGAAMLVVISKQGGVICCLWAREVVVRIAGRL